MPRYDVSLLTNRIRQSDGIPLRLGYKRTVALIMSAATHELSHEGAHVAWQGTEGGQDNSIKDLTSLIGKQVGLEVDFAPTEICNDNVPG